MSCSRFLYCIGVLCFAYSCSALSLNTRFGDVNGSNTLYDVSEVMTNLVSQTELANLDTSYRWFGVITNENQSVQYVTFTYDYPTNLIIDLPKDGETKDWIVYVTAITNVTLKFPEVNWWSRDDSVFNDIQPNRPTALYFSQVASNTFAIGRQEIRPIALPSNNVAISSRSGVSTGAFPVQQRTMSSRRGVVVKYCRPSSDGDSLIYAPYIFPPNPAVPTEAEYNAHGFYRNSVSSPMPPSGKVVSAKKYVIENNEVVAQYEYEDAMPIKRTFFKKNLEMALFNSGYLNAVDSYIDSQTLTNSVGHTMPLRRIYNSSIYISEESPYFTQATENLKETLGVTNEEIEQVLTAAEGANEL